MIFDHQYYRPFIDPVMPGGKPAALLSLLSWERRVERSLKPVRVSHAYFNLVEMSKGRNDDLRGERQRGDDSQGATVPSSGPRGTPRAM